MARNCVPYYVCEIWRYVSTLAPPAKGTDGVSTTRENNPYFTVAQSLSQLQKLSNSEALQDRVVMVSGYMHGNFETCMEKKDPIPLLLLYLWYTRAREGKWLMKLQYKYEIPVICIYLQRYH